MSRMPSITAGMDGELYGKEGSFEGDWVDIVEQIEVCSHKQVWPYSCLFFHLTTMLIVFQSRIV